MKTFEVRGVVQFYIDAESRETAIGFVQQSIEDEQITIRDVNFEIDEIKEGA